METIKKTVTKFYSGDLNNGDINPFDTYEEAYADYKEMAESCAQTDRGDETVSLDQAVSESMDFHYVRKEVTTYDEDGEVESETSEILDGGVEQPGQHA